jgi:hypothetical protein
VTGLLLRFLVLALVSAAIWWGVRRIWRDWTRQFKAEEREVRQRDLEERKRPDVITLKRDADGTYRRPGDDSPP